MRAAVTLLALALVLLAVLSLGGLALFATGSSEVVVDAEPPRRPPADGSYGIVHGEYKEKGLGVFGWDIINPEYVALVGFVPPAGCEPPESGQQLAPVGSCESIPAGGKVSGGGTTFDGHRLVVVSVRISEECQEALQPGDHWPSSLPACAEN